MKKKLSFENKRTFENNLSKNVYCFSEDEGAGIFQLRNAKLCLDIFDHLMFSTHLEIILFDVLIKLNIIRELL